MKVCPTCNRAFTEDHLSYCTSCGTPLVVSSQSASSSQSGQQIPDEDLMKTMLSPTPPSGPQSFSSLNEPAPPSPFGSAPSSFNDPAPSSSMETMIAPPSLFSEPGTSRPSSSSNEPPSSSSAPQSSPLYGEPTISSKPFAEPPPQQSGSPFDAPYQPLFGGQPIAPSGAFGQPSQPEWGPPPPPGQAWGASGAVGMAGGYPQAQQQALPIVSLVLGIVSVVLGICCYSGFLTGPAAIITGIIAMVQIKNNPMLYKGKGFAIGGIIMGALGPIIVILYLILVFGISIIGNL